MRKARPESAPESIVFGRIRETKEALVLCPLPARTCLLFASQRADGGRSGSPDSGSRSQWPGADKGCDPGADGQSKTADSCRPEPGVGAGRGRSEWAGEAKRVGKGELVCSRPEAGRGKDSPPRRMQTSAIKARVRQGVRGNSFHSAEIALAAGKAGRSAWFRASIP